MKIDLGCGDNKRVSDAVGIDKRDYPDVDIVCDIEEEGLPFDDDVASRVYAYSVLEHIDALSYVMEEIHRVCEAGGVLEGKVPHYRDKNAYTDPTHTRFFSCDTFDFWDSWTKLGERNYFDIEFSVKKAERITRLQFWRSRPIKFKLKVVK